MTIYWDYFDFDSALRLLHSGRERLGTAGLYAYEAGAIYENKREYARAVEEYLKGALAEPGSSAENRLLQLARRPTLRDLVDQSTARAAALPNPRMDAVELRVKVLEVQNRKQEMSPFLDAVVTGAKSIEQAEAIENLAQAYLTQSVATASCYAPDGHRGQWLVDAVRQNHADGVIFCAPSFCDPALLEQPMLVAALEGEHIPHTQFKYSEDTGQFAVIREQAGTFSDSIRLWSEA